MFSCCHHHVIWATLESNANGESWVVRIIFTVRPHQNYFSTAKKPCRKLWSWKIPPNRSVILLWITDQADMTFWTKAACDERRQTDVIKNVYAMTMVCSSSRADQSNTNGNTAESIHVGQKTPPGAKFTFKTAENLISENQPVCQRLILSVVVALMIPSYLQTYWSDLNKLRLRSRTGVEITNVISGG